MVITLERGLKIFFFILTMDLGGNPMSKNKYLTNSSFQNLVPYLGGAISWISSKA